MESTTQSASVAKFAAAFVKAQKEIKGAVKDASNAHFKTTYADLASVMEACREALNNNGIAVIQRGAPSGQGKLALETILIHESGEWMSGVGEVSLGRGDGPQAYGSAITYARRYFLAAMVGVCPEDDDAETAEGRGRQSDHTRQQAPPRMQPAPTTQEQADAIALEWAACIAESLRTRPGFDGPAIKRAAEAICARYGVQRLRDVPQDKWGAVDKAITSGALDKYAAAEPAAA